MKAVKEAAPGPPSAIRQSTAGAGSVRGSIGRSVRVVVAERDNSDLPRDSMASSSLCQSSPGHSTRISTLSNVSQHTEPSPPSVNEPLSVPQPAARGLFSNTRRRAVDSWGFIKGKLHAHSILAVGNRDASFLVGEAGRLVVLGVRFDEGITEAALLAITRPTWFSYRKGFPRLTNSCGRAYQSDVGWGCVHRCGQMMFLEALTRHLHARDFADGVLLNEFRDAADAPFSLHNIAKRGESCGRRIGEWFYPSTVAKCLQSIVRAESARQGSLLHTQRMDVLVLQPPTLHPTALSESMKTHDGVLVLIPQRLGLNNIDPAYYSSLKRCLECPWSVGVIGGRPNHSLFIIGYRGSQLIFMDPHDVQPAFSSPSNVGKTTDPHRSSLPMGHLDPTCLFCFYVPSSDQAEGFMSWLGEYIEVCVMIGDVAETHTHTQSTRYPLISVTEDLPLSPCSHSDDNGMCTHTHAPASHIRAYTLQILASSPSTTTIFVLMRTTILSLCEAQLASLVHVKFLRYGYSCFLTHSLLYLFILPPKHNKSTQGKKNNPNHQKKLQNAHNKKMHNT